MTAEFAVEVFRSMLTIALIMVMPLLATALFVGLVISLLQAVTSIQEQTLSFVPKLIAVVVVMMFIAFWLVEKILTFTIEIFNRMAGMAAN
jgi:flagellar biosynthetic protein FliQ